MSEICHSTSTGTDCTVYVSCTPVLYYTAVPVLGLKKRPSNNWPQITPVTTFDSAKPESLILATTDFVLSFSAGLVLINGRIKHINRERAWIAHHHRRRSPRGKQSRWSISIWAYCWLWASNASDGSRKRYVIYAYMVPGTSSFWHHCNSVLDTKCCPLPTTVHLPRRHFTAMYDVSASRSLHEV